jgi:hypothetical protein
MAGRRLGRGPQNRDDRQISALLFLFALAALAFDAAAAATTRIVRVGSGPSQALGY